MIVSSEELAQVMLLRLRKALGYDPQVEQIDFVPTEDGECTMAYVYSADADCLPVLLPVADLNVREVEAMVVRGLVSVRTH